MTRFADGDHHVDALELLVVVSEDPAEHRRLREAHLDALEAGAGRAEGLAAGALLRRAAQFAARHGLREREEALLQRLQSMHLEGGERLLVQQEIDRELVEAEIEATAGAGADDLAQALRLIGSYGPPGGTQQEVDQAVAEQRDGSITEIFDPAFFAPGTSIPIFEAIDEPGRKAMATGRHRAFASNYFAVLLIDPMLHRAGEHHGRPDHLKLSALWATDVIGPERGERLARALELFWDGHPDDCAHLLVPRLESVLRNLAQASGMLVRKSPKPGALGGVKSLRPVMRYLREVSDDDPWICHLEALLCDPLSLNLRNSVAHGLQQRVGAPDAALLLQAACWLLRLRPAES